MNLKSNIYSVQVRQKYWKKPGWHDDAVQTDDVDVAFDVWVVTEFTFKVVVVVVVVVVARLV